LPAGAPSRSAYSFLHTRVLDLADDVRQWRFTEIKPVVNDLTTSSTGRSGADALRRLRIVPMSFPFFTTKDESSSEMELAAVEPLGIWFSAATLTGADEDDSGGSANFARTVLLRPDGSAPEKDHPAFKNDDAFTCAGCHMRRVSTEIDPATGRLAAIPHMKMRHIGRGDGAGSNGPCNALMRYRRSAEDVALSDFLLVSANGYALAGLDGAASHPPAAVAAAGPGGGLDAYRCFADNADPAAESAP
jgi:hypothetical protein